MTSISPLTRPRPFPAAPPDTLRALEAALAGGPAVAPLPEDPVQAQRALRMLQPQTELEADDIAAVVSTSGSTGEPKGVLLSRRAVLASVEATHHRLGGRGRWLLAVPIFYVAGLMVAARSLVAGADPVPVGSDLSGLSSSGLLRGPHRTYLSLVPTQLYRAIGNPALTDALGRLDAILLGGGPAEPDLLARAREAGINVVTTYGMSETCGGCVYDGVPLPGVEVDVAADQRIRIRGSVLFSGYRLRSDLTESALVDRHLVTADRGRIVDGRLEVLGRVDDVVISGGQNVDLAAVENAVRSAVPGTEVVVVGVPDPEWGAEVVAVTDGYLTLEELLAGLDDRFDAAARPRRLVRLGRLPRTGSGKVDRRAVIEQVAAR